MPIQTQGKSVQRKTKPAFFGVKKVGHSNIAKLSAEKMGELIHNSIKRKFILQVPADILAANPDKEFFYINYSKFAESGGYHPKGYRPYRLEKDEKAVPGDLSKSADGLLHRKEMILAYLPKEEYEELKLEQAVAKQGRSRNYENLILSKSNLRDFKPQATVDLNDY